MIGLKRMKKGNIKILSISRLKLWSKEKTLGGLVGRGGLQGYVDRTEWTYIFNGGDLE